MIQFLTLTHVCILLVQLTLVELPQSSQSQGKGDAIEEQISFNKSLKNLIPHVDNSDQEMTELNDDSNKGIVKVVPVNNEIVVSDFVETVTLYKCRACTFSSAKEDELTSHLRETHLQVSIVNLLFFKHDI